ncbi:hypothetical protein ACP70R_030608 [Stipagrostis hirtigluma subsp. patula]
MEPVASAAAQEQPAAVHQLGQAQCRRGWRGWAHLALGLVLFLAVTVSFAGAAYRARRRPRDLAFVLLAYYLLALLLCCVAKLEQLQRDPAAGAVERRRVRLAVWAVSVALANTFASRVADAMPGLALKLAVWGVTAVVLGLGFYFLFCCKEAELGNADHAGRRPEELSPEQKV